MPGAPSLETLSQAQGASGGLAADRPHLLQASHSTNDLEAGVHSVSRMRSRRCLGCFAVFGALGSDTTGNIGAMVTEWASTADEATSRSKVSVLFLEVVIIMAFPAVDVTTDFVIALPEFWRTSTFHFCLQLAFIIGGNCVGALAMLAHDRVWQQSSRLPEWLRALVLVGAVLLFPLSPYFILITAVITWIQGDAAALTRCLRGAVFVSYGELLESLLGLLLQVAAAMEDATVSFLWVSVAVGVIAATQGAIQYDMRSKLYFEVSYTSGDGDAQHDVEAPVITGFLEGYGSPLSLLVAAFRLAEILSSLARLTLFHRCAGLQLWGLPVGGAVLLALDCMVHSCLFLSSELSLKSLAKGPVATVFLPMPILDSAEHHMVWRQYTARAVAVILSLAGCSLRGPVSRAFVTAWIAMWPLLFSIRHLAVAPTLNHFQLSRAQACGIDLARGATLRTLHASASVRGDARYQQFWFEAGRSAVQHAGVTLKVDEVTAHLALGSADLVALQACVCSPILQYQLPVSLQSFSGTFDSLNLGEGFMQSMINALPPKVASLHLSFNQTKRLDTDFSKFPLHLKQLTLQLADSHLSDGSLGVLKESLPKGLEKLHLNLSGVCISEEAVLEFTQALPSSLRCLSLNMSRTNMTDVFLDALSKLGPAVQSLEVSLDDTAITPRFLSGLPSALPACVMDLNLSLKGAGLMLSPAAPFADSLLRLGLDISRSNAGDAVAGLVRALPRSLQRLRLRALETPVCLDGLAWPVALDSLHLDLGHPGRADLLTLPEGLGHLVLDLTAWRGALPRLPPGLRELTLHLSGTDASLLDSLTAVLPPNLQALYLTPSSVHLGECLPRLLAALPESVALTLYVSAEDMADVSRMASTESQVNVVLQSRAEAQHGAAVAAACV